MSFTLCLDVLQCVCMQTMEWPVQCVSYALYDLIPSRTNILDEGTYHGRATDTVLQLEEGEGVMSKRTL